MKFTNGYRFLAFISCLSDHNFTESKRNFAVAVILHNCNLIGNCYITITTKTVLQYTIGVSETDKVEFNSHQLYCYDFHIDR